MDIVINRKALQILLFSRAMLTISKHYTSVILQSDIHNFCDVLSILKVQNIERLLRQLLLCSTSKID